MKPLKEALISKDKRNWASKGKYRNIIVFVPNPNTDKADLLLSDEDFLDIRVRSKDYVNAFLIVGRSMLKKILPIVDADDKDYWYVPKDDYTIHNLDKLEELIEKTEFYSYDWEDTFDEIAFNDL